MQIGCKCTDLQAIEGQKYEIAETRDPQITCNAKSSMTEVIEAYPMSYLSLISEQTKYDFQSRLFLAIILKIT